MLGAKVFEKHFTLNRSWKGTDQSFSLEPNGLRKLCRNLNRIPKMLGSKNKKFLSSEKKPIEKMRKMLVANKNLELGHKITLKDISFKSPGKGLEPHQYNLIVNKKLIKKIIKDEKFTFKHVKMKKITTPKVKFPQKI